MADGNMTYVRWPGGAAGPWVADVYKSLGADGMCQGPFWWIKAAVGGAGPWYWWTPTQQPYNFQLANMLPGYHNPSDCEGLFQNGWNRLPMSGVIHISPDRLCPYPIDPFGWNSLEDAVTHGHYWDGSFSPIDMSDNPGSPAHNFPDLWQVTGVAPPAHDASEAVKLGAYSTLATTWQSQWQTTSDAYNNLMAGCVGEIPEGGTKFGFPSTAFKVPLGNPSVPPHGIGDGTYIGGIPAGFWFSGGDMWIGQPAYARYLNVGQLNQDKWDCTDPYFPTLRPPH